MALVLAPTIYLTKSPGTGSATTLTRTTMIEINCTRCVDIRWVVAPKTSKRTIFTNYGNAERSRFTTS